MLLVGALCSACEYLKRQFTVTTEPGIPYSVYVRHRIGIQETVLQPGGEVDGLEKEQTDRSVACMH